MSNPKGQDMSPLDQLRNLTDVFANDDSFDEEVSGELQVGDIENLQAKIVKNLRTRQVFPSIFVGPPVVASPEIEKAESKRSPEKGIRQVTNKAVENLEKGGIQFVSPADRGKRS